MTVWLTIPAKRPPETSTLSKWRAMGYGIAVQVDPDDPHIECAHVLRRREYSGYAKAVNSLIHDVMDWDLESRWFIAAGDDIEPDPQHTPEEIAKECATYFVDLHARECRWIHGERDPQKVATWGVMQPTGDRWGEDERWAQVRYPKEPAYIDRICGSAWIGREFARRMYQGKGPLFEGYWHMHVDEELQEVAKKMGVLWQRRDLIQYHHHAQRAGGDVPDFLKRAYSPEHWKESSELFQRRQSQGFPGHDPIL